MFIHLLTITRNKFVLKNCTLVQDFIKFIYQTDFINSRTEFEQIWTINVVSNKANVKFPQMLLPAETHFS